MEAASVQAGTPAKRRSRGLSERRLAAFMVSPSMIVMLLVAAWPIAYAIWLSLHDYSVIHPGLSRWAGSTGLRNYSDVLWGDYSGDFWSAVRVTLIFTAFSVFFEFILGLAMALAMHAAFRGQGLLRTVVLVPWAVLTVVTAIMWRTIFDPTLGFVNNLLGTNTIWLGEQPQALIVLIVADVWKTAPFMALLLLAGLQVIPGDVYEAAKVDGASMWQRFTKITLPLLRPAIVVALIFRTLDALRIFDLPFVLTQGAHGTTTLSILAQQTFQTNNIQGRGSALSVLTFVLVMIVSFLYIRLVGGNIRGLEEA
jgi:multiple sugar transport system permease protein